VALRRRAPNTAFGSLLILGVLLARLPPAVPAAVFLGAAFVLMGLPWLARVQAHRANRLEHEEPLSPTVVLVAPGPNAGRCDRIEDSQAAEDGLDRAR